MTPATITSASVGSADRFATLSDLRRALDELPVAPSDGGRVVWIVRRCELGRREAPLRVRLTPESGVAGDAWINRPDPAGQIAVMQADVARLIANGQPLELFGDNLFLDLDLSVENIPPGSRVRVGDALVEVTSKPHDGCRKFRARFGGDALRFVSEPHLRHRNLRGIYLRVLEGGDISVGDPATVIGRAHDKQRRADH
jgi:MOSC domain-containing protein YiiM